MAADGRRSARPARDPYAAWYGPDKGIVPTTNRGPTIRSDGAIEQFDKGCDGCHHTGVVWNDPTTGFPCPYCRPDEYDGRIVRPDGSVER